MSTAAVDVTPDRPILIDKFLENAIEAEADAVADGEDAFIPAVMEHIELAGIHSGDSACVIPPISITRLESLQHSDGEDCNADYAREKIK
jgi:carbamoyl-phosphate synthase large subunit